MIKELKYMIIEYSDKDLDYIDDICKIIDSKSKEIVEFFEIDQLDNKVKVKLFSDIVEFRNFHNQVFNKEPKNWVCGFALDNSVYTLSLSEYKKCFSHENATILDLIRLVLHEFTHVVHSKRNDNLECKWLREGLATYLSGQYEDANEIKCTYDELLNGCSYTNYKAMFEYVLNTYGKEYILKLIDHEELLNRDSKRLFEEAVSFYKKEVVR